MKIKTINRSWSNLLFPKDTEGPTVDLIVDDVSSVESANSGWTPLEFMTVYLYQNGGKPTLTVKYTELAKVSPDLAERAVESMKRKANAPDPLCGSCT